MEVTGVGTDIIEIERVAEVIRRHPRFAERVFTPRELEYCLGRKNWPQHAAARWAAKEAIAKAIGRSLSWHDVEIINGAHGKPNVVLHGTAKEIVGSGKILLSLSHSHNYATAVALWVSAEGEGSDQ